MAPVGRMGPVSWSLCHFPRSRLGANCQKSMVNRSAADTSTQSGIADKHRTLSKGSVYPGLAPRARHSAVPLGNRRRSAWSARPRASRDLSVRAPAHPQAAKQVWMLVYARGLCYYLPPAQPPLLSSTSSIEHSTHNRYIGFFFTPAQFLWSIPHA